MNDILNGKRIWITGSARGLGLELSMQLAKENAMVFFGSRFEKNKYLKNFPVDFIERKNVQYIQCDVRNIDSIKKAYSEIKAIASGIDVLINNAGIVIGGKSYKIQQKDIEDMINTNLYGSINCFNEVVPDMFENKFGAIINISSVTSNTTFKNVAGYSATKAGLEAFFRSAREELRSMNIKVVNIKPGAMDTEIWDESFRETKAHLMLSIKNTASAIVAVTKLCFAEELLVEEIVLRPQTGDL